MAAMDFRRARAPIALIMLLVLGIWSASAFADKVVTVATTVVTDTVPTDPTATSPITDTTATTGTTTSTATSTTPADTATSPVVTATTPTADTTPVGSQAGASTTPDSGTPPANDPGAGASTPAAGQTAGAAAGTASAGAAAAKARTTHKAKTRRARSSGAAARGPRPQRAPIGGIISKKRHRHASSATSPATTTTTTSKTVTKTKATTTRAGGSRVSPLHRSNGKPPATAGSAQPSDVATSSNKQAPLSSDEHGGVGFETPRGRLSISPSGFRFGGSQRSIASVDGLLTAVLDTLAVLAALAAIIGAGAALSSFRRRRRASRSHARVEAVERRTRQELYAVAKRLDIAGRSSMTKAQLELAVNTRERERDADRPQQGGAPSRMRQRRGPLPRIEGVDRFG